MFSGPTEPATNRSGPAAAARDASARDVQVVDGVLEPVVGLSDGRRSERVRRRDIGTGGEVRVVHGTDDLGLRQVQQVGIIQQVARVVGEPLASKVGLVQATVLKQHSPGAVEHEDALLRQFPDLACDVARS